MENHTVTFTPPLSDTEFDEWRNTFSDMIVERAEQRATIYMTRRDEPKPAMTERDK